MLKSRNLYLILLFSIITGFTSYAQEVQLSGILTDNSGLPVFGASVTVPAKQTGTVTNAQGLYSIRIPANETVIVIYSFIGYASITDTLISAQQNIVLNHTMTEQSESIDDVVVQGIKERDNSLTRINMKSVDYIPTTSGNFEDILKSFSGVVSGNELSSQYSVRGGNFDENLVYVNDIEIHRPMLVQSAQQEGLSFINPEMISSIQFSAGGFESKYGDKMSSVLDINYSKPDSFQGSIAASLLGASIHMAGADKSKKLSFNTGFRYKTSQYLLNSLDVTGEYMPRFGDLQAFLNYDINKKHSVSVLGNYSTNRFTMIPQTRSTDFGTIQQTLNFNVYYEGQEKDQFDSWLGAVTYSYTPVYSVSLKFIASAYQTNEEVSYDILSQYKINQLSRGSGSGDSDTSINIGIGTSLEHARNLLDAKIQSLEHKGVWFNNESVLNWGVKLQYEEVDDRLKEWRMIDSAGMAVPYNGEEIAYEYNVAAQNFISSLRYQAYVQNKHNFSSQNAEYALTYGLRGNYWNFNKQLLLSPRASLSLKPYWEKNINFFIAAGLYGQPPFYKEIKDYTGLLFPEKRAQKSIHFVLGTDVHYTWWDRPFLFTTEIYYKYLYDIIPYKTDNIQLQYIPKYTAKGFSTGIDLRVNGEFVPGVESWFSLSVLKSMEDTYNDYTKNTSGVVTYPGYYRRPTDQRVTFSIFFQDYLPSNPNYKVHLLFNYGSGLPYSGPTKDVPSEIYPLNQYRRVDVGFSRIIKRQKNAQIGFNDIWLSFEILNLLDASNMASYDWIRTVENNTGYQDFYAIPNYLTGRRLNIKISTKL